MDEQCYVAYLVTNRVDGKRYVGVTNDFVRRHKRHRAAVVNKAPQLLARAIRRHGLDQFSFDVIACAKSYEDLLILEVALIAQHRTYAHAEDGWGYNMTLGGEGSLGYKHGPEARAKLGRACIGRKLSPSHIEALRRSRIGISPSPDHIEALRRANTGKKYTPETLARRSAALKGIPCKPHVVEIARAYNTGRPKSEETKQKLRQAHLGKKLSDEHKAKIGAAGRGRKLSAEAIEKMRVFHKARMSSDAAKEVLRARVSKWIQTPLGTFRGAKAAALAHGFHETKASRLARRRQHGWSYIACPETEAAEMAA